MKTTTPTAPRIYVACLSSYNAGILHGRWIDAAQDADEIQQEVLAMLDDSTQPGSEEWAIHDFEGFAGLPVEEYSSFEHIAEWADLIAEHGPAYGVYAEAIGTTYATPEGFEDCYRGAYDSEKDFGEEQSEWEFYELRDTRIWSFFDIDHYTHELFLDGFWSARDVDGQLHVFSDR